MGGRFGKYGDAKRKALIRRNRLRPPVSRRRKKDEPHRGAGKGTVQRWARRGRS